MKKRMEDLKRRRRSKSGKGKFSLDRSRLVKKRGYLTGVCEGIGDYLGMDPNVIRVGFAVGTFFSMGTALLLYLGLAAFLPQEESDEFSPFGEEFYEEIDGGTRVYRTRPVDSQDEPSLSVCTQCDTVSKPYSKYCHKCGAKL